jgi:hypothetical protein
MSNYTNKLFLRITRLTDTYTLVDVRLCMSVRLSRMLHADPIMSLWEVHNSKGSVSSGPVSLH